MANIYDPQFEPGRRAPDGFRALVARVGRQAGTERLGMSLWELGPGETAYPYHFHLVDEEIIIVLEGDLSLRDVDGWRKLAKGEVISFHAGPAGAHQICNTGQPTARFLALSTSGHPDATIYPDSEKVALSERRPNGFSLRVRYPDSARVDYWDGEAPPSPPLRKTSGPR